MSYREQNYASVVRRVLAYAFDVILLFIALTILGRACASILYLTVGFDWIQNGFLSWFFIFSIVSIPIWLYYSLLESSARQATFGMRLFGLQVTDTGNKRISFGRALLRTVVKLLPFEIIHLIVLLLMSIWSDSNADFRVWFLVAYALMILYFATMFLTRRRQSVHDLVAGTVIVNAT